MVPFQRTWTHLASTTSVLERWARAIPGSTVTHHTDERSIVLTTRFADPRYSRLVVDADAPSVSVCVAFGARQSISDYPIEPRWLLALLRAVVDGGWSETEVRVLGLHVASFARLRVGGRSASFMGLGPVGGGLVWPLGPRWVVTHFERWPRPPQVRS